MSRQRVMPVETRDQYDQAEAWYNDPLRSQNRQLTEENLLLKKLLRENGLSWPSAIAQERESATRSSRKRTSSGTVKVRVTRSSTFKSATSISSQLPALPVEIQLQILEYSLTSKYPIIDPLSKTTLGHLTPEELKRAKENQIAIGFLATCKAYHVEGTRFLWKNNTFIFTSHHALRNLANLSLELRSNITSVNLRIIGKFYDDEKRTHRVRGNTPGARRITIRPALRVRENTMSRKGFKSYTWFQLIDFLDALRPPFDPFHNEKEQRPRLLPELKSMRIDLVNFLADFLHFPDHGLHFMASHDLGCTLDELMVTGLPYDDTGFRSCSDLTGMVKDDGLMIKATDAFTHTKNVLRRTPDSSVELRVIRPWKVLAKELMDMLDDPLRSDDEAGYHGHHHLHGINFGNPSVPEEPDHPVSLWQSRRTVWKRVPKTRDSDEREWAEFSRGYGSRLRTYDPDADKDEFDDLICDGCGQIHDPYASSEHDLDW